MNAPSANVENTVIGQVITKFIAGDPSMFEMMAEDIDFRIDHFRDETDINWQQAKGREALATLVGRLGAEVFPQGTRALSVTGAELGDGWYLTSFHQQFFYGVRQEEVKSQTYILSHEADGLLDYFRETVTNVVKA